MSHQDDDEYFETFSVFGNDSDVSRKPQARQTQPAVQPPPCEDEYFKGFTVLDDVPSFYDNSRAPTVQIPGAIIDKIAAQAHVEVPQETVRIPAEVIQSLDKHTSKGGKWSMRGNLFEGQSRQQQPAPVTSFVGRLRQQRQDAQQRPPQGGHYL